MSTLVIQPGPDDGKDTWLYMRVGGYEDFNYGLSPLLLVGCPGWQERRSLIQFSLDSLPVGAQISVATLTLHCEKPGGDTVEIRRALTEWWEGDRNGTTPVGYGSTASRRNWNPNYSWGGSVLGGQSGTDFAATPETIATVSTTGAKTFDLTALVAAWWAGTVSNNGIWITHIGGGGEHRFTSSNGTTEENRPKLTIEYTLPAASGVPFFRPAFAGPFSRGGFGS